MTKEEIRRELPEYQQKNIIAAYNRRYHKQYHYSDKNKELVVTHIKTVIDALGDSISVQAAYTSLISSIKYDVQSERAKLPDTGFVNSLSEAVSSVVKRHTKEKPAPEEPTQTQAKQATTADTSTTSNTSNIRKETNMSNNQSAELNLLASVIAQTINAAGIDSIKAGIAADLTNRIDEYMKATYGPQLQTIRVETPTQTREIKGLVHQEIGTVLNYISNDEPLLLVGPAGTGKSHLVEQAAHFLGLDFYTDNSITLEHQVMGFIDAQGVYRDTEFYRAYTLGGVYFLDEMDNSDANALTKLNTALANGYHTFPCGTKKRHPNFRIVAAANTYGLGADLEYVERNRLGAATLDRFGTVYIDYDPRIEEALSLGDNELVGFCRAFRKACSKAGIRVIISYRAIKRMAKLGKGFNTTEDLLRSCLTKALDKQDLRNIKDDCQGYGKYSAALNKLAAY